MVPGNTEDQIRKIKNNKKKHFENLKNMGQKRAQNRPKNTFFHLSVHLFHFGKKAYFQ